jgi:hypothetical protein
MTGNVACMEPKGIAHKLLVGKPEGMRTLGKYRYK